MKKLLKVLLPPLIAFMVFLVVVKFNMAHHSLALSNISDGNIYSLMAYYKLFAPLLFVVALLTQLLVIVPLRNKLLLMPGRAYVITFFAVAIICLVFSTGVSYTIWDQEQGIAPFERFIGYFTIIQLNYWAITFLMLYLLDIKTIHKTKTPEKTE
jgi:hypothetical protein